MAAAKNRKGKKSSATGSKARKQRRRELERLLQTGWLKKEAKALRKKVGLPEEGLEIEFEKGEYWIEEVDNWWAGVYARAQKKYAGRPPEEDQLTVFWQGIDRIMEKSGLKDEVWREFFAGYVVGYLESIDEMPMPVSRAYIWTGPVGYEGHVETVIRFRGLPSVREMRDLLRTLKSLDSIWRADAPSPREREEARIYELVETRQDWYPFDVDETPKPVSPRAAMRQIAIRRLREKYRPFGDDMKFSEKELDLEFYDVRNAYDREKKQREAQGD